MLLTDLSSSSGYAQNAQKIILIFKKLHLLNLMQLLILRNNSDFI